MIKKLLIIILFFQLSHAIKIYAQHFKCSLKLSKYLILSVRRIHM